MVTTSPSCLSELLGSRQITFLIKLITMGLISSAAFLSDTPAVNAESRTIGPAQVKGVVIEGLRGSLIVDIARGNQVELAIDGDAEAVNQLEASIDNEAIRLSMSSGDTNIDLVDGNISVITSGGGTSHVQIGDKTYTTNDEPIELHVRAKVPIGTVLHLTGLVGNTEIGDTEADVVLHCVSCEASLGAIAALDLVVAGSGKVSVDQIDRALVAEISGGGRLDIENGGVDSAEINIVGSGEIDFNGHAVDALVNIVGSGNVRIREVDNPIRSSIIGSGDVITDR